MDDFMEKIQEVLSDEESMKQLGELASSLFPSSENQSDNSEEEQKNVPKNHNEASGGGIDLDLGTMLKIGQLMSTATEDKNAELLHALKPLLKEERRAKVDKALKILKLLALWKLLKDSGMLNELF